jgi:hypothetical protein
MPTLEAQYPTDSRAKNSTDPPSSNRLFLLPIERQTLHTTFVPPIQCVNRGFPPVKYSMFVHIRWAVYKYDQIFVMGPYEPFFNPRLDQGAERIVEVQNVKENHGFGMKANLCPTDCFKDLRRLGELSVVSFETPQYTDFFICAKPSGQRDEAARTCCHFNLAIMHRIHDYLSSAWIHQRCRS